VQGLPAGQRPSAGDVLDPAAIRNQALVRHHCIKLLDVVLCEAVLLGDVNLRVGGKREWVSGLEGLHISRHREQITTRL